VKTERINSTKIRHEWRRIVEGLGEGKVYLVETFGRPEAVVMSPGKLNARAFNLDKHFEQLRKEASVPLSRIEITRSEEI